MICSSDFSWDLSDVVFSPLLDKPESTRDHWDSCCFGFHGFSISILRSLYFGSFSTAFKEVLFSLGIDMSMSRQALFSLSFTTMSGLFALISFVCLDWHVPEYSHFIGKWSFLCSIAESLFPSIHVILTGFHSLTWLDVSVQLMSQILTSKHG